MRRCFRLREQELYTRANLPTLEVMKLLSNLSLNRAVQCFKDLDEKSCCCTVSNAFATDFVSASVSWKHGIGLLESWAGSSWVLMSSDTFDLSSSQAKEILASVVRALVRDAFTSSSMSGILSTTTSLLENWLDPLMPAKTLLSTSVETNPVYPRWGMDLVRRYPSYERNILKRFRKWIGGKNIASVEFPIIITTSGLI